MYTPSQAASTAAAATRVGIIQIGSPSPPHRAYATGGRWREASPSRGYLGHLQINLVLGHTEGNPRGPAWPYLPGSVPSPNPGIGGGEGAVPPPAWSCGAASLET